MLELRAEEVEAATEAEPQREAIFGASDKAKKRRNQVGTVQSIEKSGQQVQSKRFQKISFRTLKFCIKNIWFLTQDVQPWWELIILRPNFQLSQLAP